MGERKSGSRQRDKRRCGMLRRVVTAAALCALASAQPAVAQLAPGYSGQSSAPREGTQDEFWWGLRSMGECLAKTKRKLAVALLATEPNSKAEAAASRALLGKNTSCLRDFVSMRLPTMYVRGTVAEHLYKQAGRAAAAADTAVVPAKLDASKPDSINPYALLHDFARCYAAARPGDVHRLLIDTKAGSGEEAAALGALKPGFGVCLPRNVNIDFEPGETRAALAEAQYHRSNGGAAARPAS